MIVEHAETEAIKICTGADHEPHWQSINLDDLTVVLVLCKDCAAQIIKRSNSSKPEVIDKALQELLNLPEIDVKNNRFPSKFFGVK